MVQLKSTKLCSKSRLKMETSLANNNIQFASVKFNVLYLIYTKKKSSPWSLLTI